MPREQDDSFPGLTPDHRDFVTALDTGLQVIRAFDGDHPRMTLSEVAARTGMNRAKARRFLLTLHGLGYVRRKDRYFELAPKTLQLGYAFLSSNNYQPVIRQHLERITEITGESSSMGVLQGANVIYVARSAAPHRLMTIALAVGTQLPAAATSMGRMLLATLRRITGRDLSEQLFDSVDQATTLLRECGFSRARVLTEDELEGAADAPLPRHRAFVLVAADV